MNGIKKKNVNYIIDVIILITFFIVGITGIIIFPNLLKNFGININNLPKVELYKYHHWVGLLLLIITSIHIDNYWKIFLAESKKFFIGIKNLKEIKFDKKYSRYIINLFLIITYFLVFFTGIVKFPGFLSFFGLNPLMVQYNLISLIHDYSGFIAVIFSLIHIIFYLKRFYIKTIAKIHLLNLAFKNNWKKIIPFILIILIFFTIFFFLNNEKKSDFNIFRNTENEIIIDGIDTFSFIPENISSIRNDIFQYNHFSVFDILIDLDLNEYIDLEYHFDDSMNTYVIDSINGKENWWYIVYYDGGWSENNVFRMDHYPYKDKMYIKIIRENQKMLDRIYDIFKDEIKRKSENNGKIIVPSVVIRGPSTDLVFNNVEVESHNLRNDIFQNGIITGIDVILTLSDENKLSHKLQWYDSIGSAGVVRSYWIDGINNDTSFSRCGFVYESGSHKYFGFKGNHIHLPSDTRVLNSPEYMEWFWICI